MDKPNTSGFGLGSKKNALKGQSDLSDSMDFNQRAATGKKNVGIPNSVSFSTKVENKPANRHQLGKVPGGK